MVCFRRSGAVLSVSHRNSYYFKLYFDMINYSCSPSLLNTCLSCLCFRAKFQQTLLPPPNPHLPRANDAPMKPTILAPSYLRGCSYPAKYSIPPQIQPLIHHGVRRNPPHIIPGFRKRNKLHEKLLAQAAKAGVPDRHTVLAGVVGRQRRRQ